MCGAHAGCGLCNAARRAVTLLRDCCCCDLLHSLGNQSRAKLLQTASLCLIAALLAASTAFQTNVTVARWFALVVKLFKSNNDSANASSLKHIRILPSTGEIRPSHVFKHSNVLVHFNNMCAMFLQPHPHAGHLSRDCGKILAPTRSLPKSRSLLCSSWRLYRVLWWFGAMLCLGYQSRSGLLMSATCLNTSSNRVRLRLASNMKPRQAVSPIGTGIGVVAACSMALLR